MSKTNIKIGVIGHKGRMGQEVLKVLNEKNIEAVVLNDEINGNKIDVFTKADVVIDFSSPQGLKECLECVKKTNTPLVSGSTPINNELLGEIKEINEKSKKETGKELVYWSSNMSIGIDLTKKIAKELGGILKSEDFDCEILEAHHHNKKDAPSGTAILLGKSVAEGRQVDFEKVASFDRNKTRKEGEIGFASIRGGSIFGEHEVMFIGESECISVKHIAYNRKVFAVGAVERALKMLK